MPEEVRLDRIEKKLDDEIVASATFRGELRQFMVNSDSYSKAISTKADMIRGSLEAHEKDPNAHGAGIKREWDGKLVGWLTALGGFSGVIGFLLHKMMGGGKPQ